MISFLNPNALLLFFLIPLLVMFLRTRRKVYLQRVRLWGGQLAATYDWRWSRQVLWLLVCILLIIALARPVWGTQLQPVETQGVSIVFVLDVSTSMDAEDVAPSRLEQAKRSLLDLFSQLSGKELGLVLFAGSASLKFPLTTDTLAASAFVKQVTTASISEQGTNIADGIRLAIESLNAASKGKRIVVLLTDGEGHEGSIDSVLNQALKQEITVYTIGYGDTTGALIPVRNPDGSISDKRDSKGNPVYTVFDETILKTIAASTGGTYEHASSSGNEVQHLVEHISQYVPDAVNRGIQVINIEHFDVFVALAVILLTIDIMLPRLQK